MNRTRRGKGQDTENRMAGKKDGRGQTGGGLSLLKGKIDSTFILTNCDILIEEDYEKIYNFHKKEKNRNEQRK